MCACVLAGVGNQVPTSCPPSPTPTASQTLEDAKLRPQERPRARGRLTPPSMSRSWTTSNIPRRGGGRGGGVAFGGGARREWGRVLEGVGWGQRGAGPARGGGPAMGGRPRASNRSALPRVGPCASQVRAGWRSRVWGRALLLSSLLAPGETLVSAPSWAAARRPSTTAQSSAALKLARPVRVCPKAPPSQRGSASSSLPLGHPVTMGQPPWSRA